jgi:Tfp pilus assembly protein FimT
MSLNIRCTSKRKILTPKEINKFPGIQGFSLAELIFCLGIYGLLSVFTINKIITVQNNIKYNSIYKEAMATVSNAYQEHLNRGLASSNTTPADLVQYINYAERLPESHIIDPGWSCAFNNCLKLHNGTVVSFTGNFSFGGTSSNHMITIKFDPDGVTTSPTNDLSIDIYYNGRTTPGFTRTASSRMSTGGGAASAPFIELPPAWFKL